MPENTNSMKENQKRSKNREIIQGLGYCKNTVRICFVVVDLLSLKLLIFKLVITYFGMLRMHHFAPFFIDFFPEGEPHPPRTPRGGNLIFSQMRRLGLFFWVQNSEFQYFWGFSEK